MKDRLLAVAIVSAILGVDFALERWAESTLHQDPVAILPWLGLRLHENPDLFLGLVAVAPVRILHWMVVVALSGWLVYRLWRPRSRRELQGIALLTGGMLGNMIGRLQGAALDYLAFYVGSGTWLVINFADVAVVGGTCVVLMAWRRHKGRQA